MWQDSIWLIQGFHLANENFLDFSIEDARLYLSDTRISRVSTYIHPNVYMASFHEQIVSGSAFFYPV